MTSHIQPGRKQRASYPRSLSSSEPRNWLAKSRFSRKWNKLCIFQSNVYKISLRIFFRKFRKLCLKIIRVGVTKITEFGLKNSQHFKVLWGINVDGFVFPNIFCRGSSKKFWKGDFLEICFDAESANYDVETSGRIKLDHEKVLFLSQKDLDMEEL